MTLVNVGLRGYDRRNYGSHLMALAVQNRFAPSAIAVPLRQVLVREHEVPPGSAVWLWSEIGGNPILHRSSAPVFTPTSQWAVSPRGVARIGGVVDISGYIYGDPFGIRSVRRLGDWAKRWAAEGLPLVLLPQSIGPFARDSDQEEMRRALTHVRLVVARDDHSEDTVREIGTSCEIRRAPDLAIESARTIAALTPGPDAQRTSRPYALVLPNRQVLRKLAVTEADYVRVLEHAAARSAADGLDVLVAAHAQGSDDLLCAAVAAKVPGARVLEVRSAAGMVNVVRDAQLVISSRYHGLVAAFANGVPAVAVGWASKYDDLLGEFEVPWMSAPIDAMGVDPDGAAVITGQVLGDLRRISKELSERADVLQGRLDLMWERVFEIFSADAELMGSYTSRGPQVFRRSGGRASGDVVREELWFWIEGLVAWLPGRVGRLVRSVCYQPFIRSDGALDVAEHTHIRMPWRLSCGRQVSIGRGCQLTCTETITLGDDVLLGPGVLLVSNNHEWTDPDRHIRDQGLRGTPITVDEDVWIGANVVVLPGVHIGAGAVIAAGSVVRDDVAANSVVAGAPARVVSWRGDPPDLAAAEA